MYSDSVRRLLERAALLYERHRAGDAETFNVFSVLRAESDEVKLHSRFLAALLRHRESRDPPLRNLEDFLRSVGIDNFRLDGADVERERHGIDILICNASSKQAVVIENKIWARDQHRQLARYAERMESDGYRESRLLYLTLDGRDPDEGSAEGRQFTPVSYRNIVDWLARCQERAYDEPALRESVAQYIHLIRKLTGMDLKGGYMTELRELILKNNNLVLVHDLNEAMLEAKVSLLKGLWEEMHSAVQTCISELPNRSKKSQDSEENIREFLARRGGPLRYVNLCFRFGEGACLRIEVERDFMYFGIYCRREEHRQEHDRLRNLTEGLTGNVSSLDDKFWPWILFDPRVNYKHPTRDNLEMLADDKARAEYVGEITGGLSRVWDKVRDYAVGSAQGS